MANDGPKTYLVNSFSLNMLDGDGPVTLRVRPLSLEQARKIVADDITCGALVSAVGHADTARIISDLLGVEIPPNRITVKLRRYDDAIVAQYCGPRLPEGATRLPPGAEIRFFLVEV